jgi:hypothetical protein
MARDRLNMWAELAYYDPAKVIRAAHQDGFKHKFGSRPVSPPAFKAREFKLVAEALDAAVFACGLAARRPSVEVHLTEFEAQDHDFVLRFGVAGQPYYCPLQLKQLVSEDTNAAATAESLLDGLKKYVDASDLVVAIKVDRPGVDPRSLQIPALTVGELWFFGPLHQSLDRWYIYGDCLSAPEWFAFNLPK